MSELSDIQMFVTVVHEGSFSAAARATGLTPSAVSRQIAALEEELDARLFQRTTRKQSLTEAGVTYLRYAELGSRHPVRRALSSKPAYRKSIG